MLTLELEESRSFSNMYAVLQSEKDLSVEAVQIDVLWQSVSSSHSESALKGHTKPE